LKKKRNYNVAVVGVTGAVGREMLRVLETRRFPVGQLVPLASSRSAGKRVQFKGKPVTVRELTKDSFEGVDLALFSAGGGISENFAPAAVNAGCVVVDNSSAFRMEKTVPLVVPEINAADVKGHRGIIANPNCTTIVTLMALAPLHRAFGVKRIFAATYQAVSGSGAQGIVELESQVKALVGGRKISKSAQSVYPHQIAFNALPHVDVFLENGYTKEEMKMQNEGRKILHHPRFKASTTCVRIPVYRSHSVAVNAEFARPATLAAARRAIRRAPGIDLLDDVAKNIYPLALDQAKKDNCAVGRIRLDCALKNGLSFWVAGDQLLKGAALNAVQIAEVVAGLRQK
jgi:aspartate-semialdehyde dehydrogenase